MTTVDIFAPAKLNLTLHVTGRRADGYHLLDSLVAFADIGDQITVAPCPVLSLTIGGPQAVYLSTGHSNLVLRAANFLGPQRSAAIHLDKQLPVAAGIGGGSADAAATLRALSMLWDVDLPLPEATVDLGADVPVCMIGQTLRMQGVGDQITRLPDLPDMEVVLVNPRIAVSTPDIFRGLAEKSNAPMDQDLPNWNSLDAFTEWLGHQRNDLQALAMEQQPVIADVLDALRETGALFSGMSGSGATCFGLYPPGAATGDNVVAQLSRTSWWCAQGSLIQALPAQLSRVTT